MAEGEFFRAKKKDRVASRNDTRFEQQRAVQQFRRLAAEHNPNIQMMLPLPDRQSTCSKASATCVVDGQNVPIRRARLRTPDKPEQRLRGLSTRNYGAVVQDFQDAYGFEKSAVSETRNSAPVLLQDCQLGKLYPVHVRLGPDFLRPAFRQGRKLLPTATLEIFRVLSLARYGAS